MFLAGHRQHEGDLKLVQEIFLDIVKESSHRRIFPSHDRLDPADGADHMGLVDHIPAADAHQQVFRVVRHSHHLMGNHLADGYDAVKLPGKKMSVQLRCDRFFIFSSGDLRDLFLRNDADIFRVISPVMAEEAVFRNRSEKFFLLFSCHLPVRPHRRHDPDPACFGQFFVQVRGDLSRIRITPRDIRRQNQNFLPRLYLPDPCAQCVLPLTF